MRIFAERLQQLLSYNEIENANIVAEATGISPSTIAHWLSGKSAPNFENLIAIAEYFNTTVDFLIGRNDDFLHVPNSMITLGEEEQKIFYKISKLNLDQLKRVEGYVDFLLGK